LPRPWYLSVQSHVLEGKKERVKNLRGQLRTAVAIPPEPHLGARGWKGTKWLKEVNR
jgi:hypothetical protein